MNKNHKLKMLTKANLEMRETDKKLRTEALNLVIKLYHFVRWLDVEMCKPSSPEGGQRIAKTTHQLEIMIDRFVFCSLGIDCRSLTRLKVNIKNSEKK
jgi:hypothetical protein